MIKKFEFLAHTSDLKIRAKGRSKNEVIENIVLGISEYISSGNVKKNDSERKITIQGKDSKEIVYRFVEEILFLLETENFLAKKAKILLKDDRLIAVLKGEKVEGRNFAMIKAPTYSDMSLKKIGAFWILDIVLDI